jgi:hypothetical protein
LLVQPAGSKLWRLKYRFDGKEKLPLLGAWPEIGPRDARDRRDDARRKIANRIDPGHERKDLKAAQKIATELAFENVARA